MPDSIIECYLQETARLQFGESNVECNVKIDNPNGRKWREVDLVVNAHEKKKIIRIAINYHGWHWHFDKDNKSVTSEKIQYDLDTIRFYKSKDSPYNYIITLAECKDKNKWNTSDEFYDYVPYPNSNYRKWCLDICEIMLNKLNFTDEVSNCKEYKYPSTKVISEKINFKGYRAMNLPKEFNSWKSYLEYLLSLESEDVKNRYMKKFATSKKFWANRGGVLSEETINELKNSNAKFTVVGKTNYHTNKNAVTFQEYPDDLPEVTDFQHVPSYKRMCVCVIIRDYYCNYMGF